MLLFERNEKTLQEGIQRVEQGLDGLRNTGFDSELHEDYLKDRSRVYRRFAVERKRMNHVAFSAIISYLKLVGKTAVIAVSGREVMDC